MIKSSQINSELIKMLDLIDKLYERTDSAIMAGVNKGVHAWNWTTGRTKADLANLCLNGARILYELGTLLMSVPISAKIIGSGLLIAVHINQKNNREIEKEEFKLEDVKSLEVEEYKREMEIGGNCCTTLSSIYITTGALNHESEFYIASAGLLNMSLACYVMRADYQQPRKNVVRRAYERFSELWREYQARRKLLPLPQPTG